MNRNFRQMLEAQWSRGNFVCVGLDSDYETIRRNIPFSSSPDSRVRWPDVSTTITNFNKKVEATKDLVCAYKPNFAFYAAYGNEGVTALKRTIMDIHVLAPDVPVILDAKFADISSTNAGYVKFAFEYLDADAVTVNPYLGREALQPFLDQKDKGIIVLCHTSNPGAGEFQDRDVMLTDDDQVIFFGDEREEDMEREEWLSYLPLYEYVAYRVARAWNENGNCSIVVGATCPDELRKVREIVGDMPILIPGIGFQQKGVPLEQQVEQVVSAGKDSRGQGMIINSSRGIIFASSGADFADAARRETLKLANLINQYR